MSFEREHGRAYARTRSEATDELDEIAPGRMSRTGHMASPSRPVTSEMVRRTPDGGEEGAGASGRVITLAPTTVGRFWAHAIFRKAEPGAPGRMTWSSALPALVMRSAEHPAIDPAAAELVARARRGGTPLEVTLRSRLEAALGARLDGVRVHTGADADAAARALGARAFAIGDDVFFRDGAYDPQGREGQRLIAHEVAHTVQAGGAAAPGAGAGAGAATVSHPTVSHSEDALERDADIFADAFVAGAAEREAAAGQPAPVSGAVGAAGAATIHREQEKPAPGPLDKVDFAAADQFNKDYALKPTDTHGYPVHDIVAVQSFLKVPLVIPRILYYINAQGLKISGDHYNKLTPDEQKTYKPFPPEDWKDIIGPVSRATAQWQLDWNAQHPDHQLGVNGKLDGDTMQRFGESGFDLVKNKVQTDWKAADHADYQGVRADEAKLKAQAQRAGATGTGQAIVDLAASQVGKVFAGDRGDGKKYGWERILRYYEVAYAGKMVGDKSPKEYFEATFGENKEENIDNSPKNEKGATKRTKQANVFSFDQSGPGQGPWSWCAIFAVWAARSVAGKIRWDGKVIGVPFTSIKEDPTLAHASRGDILAINSDNAHHCILAREIDPASLDAPLATIEGNLEGQDIRRCERWTRHNLVGYYKMSDGAATATDGAPAPAPAPAPDGGKKASNDEAGSGASAAPGDPPGAPQGDPWTPVQAKAAG